MKQSRLTSLIETCLSVAIGFVVSASVWPFVAWWQGFDYTFSSNIQITMFFTVLSVLRGYIIRRFFNNGLHTVAMDLATKLRRFVS